MDELRERCPWDKKQTIQSLRPQTMEEIYELSDSIVNAEWQNIKEELGDLLLHIVFYSKIGAEKNEFTFDDVVETVCNKLISRHPHIYSSTIVNSEEDVKQNWEKIKLKEGKKSILSGVPPSMPAVIKALRLQEKTKQVGFEWDHIGQVKDKVDEEIAELYEAVESGQQDKIEEEFGDVMFALVNYARFAKIDPELALEKTNQKFICRFQHMEQMAAEKGALLHDMTLEEMDTLWNKAKEMER